MTSIQGINITKINIRRKQGSNHRCKDGAHSGKNQQNELSKNDIIKMLFQMLMMLLIDNMAGKGKKGEAQGGQKPQQKGQCPCPGKGGKKPQGKGNIKDEIIKLLMKIIEKLLGDKQTQRGDNNPFGAATQISASRFSAA